MSQTSPINASNYARDQHMAWIHRTDPDARVGTRQGHRLNCAFWTLMLISLTVAANGNIEVGGFNARGWVWVAFLAMTPLWLLLRKQDPPFPWILWVPFFAFVAIRTEHWTREEIQRFGILLCPIAVATMASVLPFNGQLLRRFCRWILLASVLSYVCSALASGTPAATASWYSRQGACMTWVAMAIVAIADIGSRTLYAGMVTALCCGLAIITESRMSLLAIPVLTVVTPSSLRIRHRFLLVCTLGLAAIVAFTLPEVQESLFKSGSGDMRDLASLDPSKVEASGRLVAWPRYLAEIDNIWFGEGSGSSTEFGMAAFGWGHPHNEYIRIFFDYGIVGGILLLAPLVYHVHICWRRTLVTGGDIQWCNRICVGGILAIFLLGLTGNVLMYSVFYGNLIFAMVGYSCAGEHVLQITSGPHTGRFKSVSHSAAVDQHRSGHLRHVYPRDLIAPRRHRMSTAYL